MNATWLGQAGLLFEIKGYKILVDPYFSNSIEKNGGKKRCIAMDDTFLNPEPDAIICTHSHLDHLDPETLEPMLTTKRVIQVLGPDEAWKVLRKFGREHNYVLFNRFTQITLQEKICVHAVKAEHSDASAIGVIIRAEDKTIYITGDTLYNNEIFKDLPENIDVIFLPINGAGNNMNMLDATQFALKCKAKTVVPVHFGMFDNINPDKFLCEGRMIPEVFKTIQI